MLMALAGGMAGGHSQEAAVELPKAPYVAAQAPPNSRWAIEFKYSANSADPRPTAKKLQAKRIMRSDIVKTGEIKRQNDAYEENVSQEIWTRGNLLVLKDPDYAYEIVRRAVVGEGDFPEFQWVKDAQFLKRERVDGRDCLIFQQELFPLQFADPALFAAESALPEPTIDLGNKVSVLAYVDAESRLPVKLVIGGDTRTYAFQPPPATPLLLPAAYAGAIEGVEEKYREWVKPLARP